MSKVKTKAKQYKVIKGGQSKKEIADGKSRPAFPCTVCKTPLYTYKGTWFVPFHARLCSEECINMWLLQHI